MCINVSVVHSRVACTLSLLLGSVLSAAEMDSGSQESWLGGGGIQHGRHEARSTSSVPRLAPSTR